MKSSIVTISFVALLGFAQAGYAAQQNGTNQVDVQQQYAQLVESGKSYRDAYQALAIEIAYETAATQSNKPCAKMVRGL